MTSATTTPRGDASTVATTALKRGPIIVATDGSTSCDAALIAASRLAALHNTKVVVVSAVVPVVVVPMNFGISVPYSEIESAQRTERVNTVQTQLDRVGARDESWSTRIEYGEPAYEIATAAEELDATVVIAGLGHHELLDRILGSETTLRIVRTSRSPVLAVPGRFDELPKRMVVATDFSIASLDSARAALRLFPSITAVHMVHVMSRLEVPPEVVVTWEGLYAEPIPQSFERLTS